MVKYETLIKIIDDYIIKCSRSSPKQSSGLISIKENPPTFDPEWKWEISVEELKDIGEKMAERYGLRLTRVEEDLMIFYDEENSTAIRFKDYMHWDETIDFTNRGNERYNLDDILFYYDSLPDIMKKAVSEIRFPLDEGGASYCFSKYEDTGHRNIVVMTNESILNEKGSYYNAQTVLYHECGHALDNYLNHYDDNNIGDSKEYRKCMEGNDEKFASEYGRNYFRDNNSASEDFAETVAMVCFDDLQDKSNAEEMVMDSSTPSWRKENFEEFKKKHKSTFGFVKNILDGKISRNDLTY